jgi:AcrR family transcriptional regulator
MWPNINVKLTSGPHGLPPAQVRAVQRDRLLKATTEVVAREGYAAATVRGLLAQAGLSRRTYYDLYVDKEDCYLDAFGEIAAELERRVGTALEAGESPRRSVQLAVEALTDFCIEEPDAACAALVESLAAGQAGREARNELIARLADAFAPPLAELHAPGSGSTLVARATVGGIFELLYGPLARRDVERLRDLRGEIGELPLIGPVLR